MNDQDLRTPITRLFDDYRVMTDLTGHGNGTPVSRAAQAEYDALTAERDRLWEWGDNERDRILELIIERDRLRKALGELLLLIMDEDCAYVVGGPRQLDEAAWRIARQLPDPSPELSIYLTRRETPERCPTCGSRFQVVALDACALAIPHPWHTPPPVTEGDV